VRKVALHQPLDAAASAEEVPDEARAAAEIERQGKAPGDVIEPVREPLAHLAQQEVVPMQLLGRALAP
jgi:hypothetical protein